MKYTIRTIFLAIILVLCSQTSWAQKKLYICSDYSYTGEPMGASNVWNIPKAGGAVYFVYKNDGQKITTPRLYLFIDKMVGTDFKQYDSKTIICNKYQDWALYDYTFTEAGSYKVTVRNELGVDQASEFCAIVVDGKSEVPGETPTTDTPPTTTPGTTQVATVSSDYYIGTTVQFCEDVDADGKATRPSDVFNIGSSGGYLYVLIKSTKPLKTSQVIIDIWTGSDYKEPVETIYVDADPNSKWVKVKYVLKNKGTYKFSAFNKDQTFIEAGYLTVNVQ